MQSIGPIKERGHTLTGKKGQKSPTNKKLPALRNVRVDETWGKDQNIRNIQNFIGRKLAQQGNRMPRLVARRGGGPRGNSRKEGAGEERRNKQDQTCRVFSAGTIKKAGEREKIIGARKRMKERRNFLFGKGQLLQGKTGPWSSSLREVDAARKDKKPGLKEAKAKTKRKRNTRRGRRKVQRGNLGVQKKRKEPGERGKRKRTEGGAPLKKIMKKRKENCKAKKKQRREGRDMGGGPHSE